MAYKARKRKVKKNIPTGCVHIQATFNNTIVTISDEAGNAVSWASAAKKAYDAGMRKVDVLVKGLGPGRETAIRALATEGLEIQSITDVTPVPHNGCRPPKRPRG